MTKTVIPVILCGGSGTRLWPASREHHPKQFLRLMGDQSLLQETMSRALRISGAKAQHVVTVTLGALAEKVAAQLAAIDPAATMHILSEPVARNTAAAVAYAGAYVARTFGEDSVMWILPADHHIGNENAMTAAFLHAMQAAEEGYLATFGINPTRPDTGYGYIRIGDVISGGAIHRADAFVEKPNLATAQTYVDAGNYLWNSGMFLFSTKTLLDEYRRHAPDVLTRVEAAFGGERNFARISEEQYKTIPEAPFDKAILEKSDKVAVIPCNPAWSDIGSWESLWEIREKDTDGNVVQGNVVCYGTRDCLVQAEKRLIACAGVENLVVIETQDALLIADRSDAEAMRALVKVMKSAGLAEMVHPASIPPVYQMAKIAAAGAA